jgi:transposase-like protein
MEKRTRPHSPEFQLEVAQQVVDSGRSILRCSQQFNLRKIDR